MKTKTFNELTKNDTIKNERRKTMKKSFISLALATLMVIPLVGFSPNQADASLCYNYGLYGGIWRSNLDVYTTQKTGISTALIKVLKWYPVIQDVFEGGSVGVLYKDRIVDVVVKNNVGFPGMSDRYTYCRLYARTGGDGRELYPVYTQYGIGGVPEYYYYVGWSYEYLTVSGKVYKVKTRVAVRRMKKEQDYMDAIFEVEPEAYTSSALVEVSTYVLNSAGSLVPLKTAYTGLSHFQTTN